MFYSCPLLGRTCGGRQGGAAGECSSCSSNFSPISVQVPDHLQFNPYIHEGYRPVATAAECVQSLCYFHNETVNILTHGSYRQFSVDLFPWESLAGSQPNKLFILSFFSFLSAGLPVLYITLFSSSLIPWDKISVPILPYTHVAAVLCPWVGSAIYHTFMNHYHGYKWVLFAQVLSVFFQHSSLFFI